jgi:ribosomal protein L32
MSKQCPVCKNVSINNTTKFCHQDGAVMEELAKCTQCGEDLLVHFKFCPKCGKEQKKEMQCWT